MSLKRQADYDRSGEIRTIDMYNSYYVYIMSNKNNTTLYVGMTNSIERRSEEHKSGLIKGFTQRYNCDKLVYFEVYSDVNQAIEREKQIKSWNRNRKTALIMEINPQWIDLYHQMLR